MRTKIVRSIILFVLGCAPLLAAPTHTVTATFNYDFTVDNACSATVTTGCIKQFNVYDLSGGGKVALYSILAPAGANIAVSGITGISGPLTLKGGTHLFGVMAQMADGTESLPATVSVKVQPGNPTALVVSIN
jgi:hypothetical protein